MIFLIYQRNQNQIQYDCNQLVLRHIIIFNH